MGSDSYRMVDAAFIFPGQGAQHRLLGRGRVQAAVLDGVHARPDHVADQAVAVQGLPGADPVPLRQGAD